MILLENVIKKKIQFGGLGNVFKINENLLLFKIKEGGN